MSKTTKDRRAIAKEIIRLLQVTIRGQQRVREDHNASKFLTLTKKGSLNEMMMNSTVKARASRS